MSQNLAAQVAVTEGVGASFLNQSKFGNLQTTNTNQQHVQIAASQTKAVLGATGAVGDRLNGLIIVPATAAAGAVSLYDGSASTAISLFAGGGTTPLTDLKPFFVPINAKAATTASPGWYVTTGANVSVVAVGNFT